MRPCLTFSKLLGSCARGLVREGKHFPCQSKHHLSVSHPLHIVYHTSTGSKVWSKCELSNFFSYFVRSAQEALYVMGQNKTHTQRTHSENTQEHPGNTQRQPREYSAPIERPENTQRTPREQQENIHTYVRRTPSFLSIMGLYICSVISCTQIFVMNAYEVIWDWFAYNLFIRVGSQSRMLRNNLIYRWRYRQAGLVPR